MRSFFSASIFESLTHSAGRRRYCITVGHTHSSSISTSMPNWRNVFCIISDFSSISSWDTRFLCSISLRSFALGKSHVPNCTVFGVCFDSIIFPSSVSIGTFFVSHETIFQRSAAPFGSWIGVSVFFPFCISLSFCSSSSAFFL